MITTKQFIIGALVFVGTVNLVGKFFSDSDTETNSHSASVEAVSVSEEQANQWSKEKRIETKVASIRTQDLSKRRAEKERYDRAAKAMPDYRARVLSSGRTKWTEILNRHKSEYKSLADAAKHSHEGVECTICEGDTYLDYCIFCNSDSDGKCPTCTSGEGNFLDELCPTCQGSGNCFMCSGTKMMMCLFCDDGTIEASTPPASVIPIVQ